MDGRRVADAAAEWALSKVGCAYSQAKRTEKDFFDCSSLVARAYAAQGKKWFYGGSVPLSFQEVYDDDFELLWPEDYAGIGKAMGGRDVLERACGRGDLQFLCTDSSTGRANKITHVTMVADRATIVQARGKAYGVCTNSIDLYRGRVCAVSRYNPGCTLRTGMKGYRTLALQRALNELGASLGEDGEFGGRTEGAVMVYQETSGLPATGRADRETLRSLGLLPEEASRRIRITGGTVNLRTGPGTDYPIVRVAKEGETYEAVDADGWLALKLDGEVRWVSKKYAEETDSA